MAIKSNIGSANTFELDSFMSFLKSLKDSVEQASQTIDARIECSLSGGGNSKLRDNLINDCVRLSGRAESQWRWFLELIETGKIGGNLAPIADEFRQIMASIHGLFAKTQEHFKRPGLADDAKHFEAIMQEVYAAFPPPENQELDEAKKYSGNWISLGAIVDELRH